MSAPHGRTRPHTHESDGCKEDVRREGAPFASTMCFAWSALCSPVRVREAEGSTGMDGDVYEELGTNFVQAPCRKHRVMQCPEGGAVWCRCKSTHAAEVVAVQILGTALGLVLCWTLFPVCRVLGPSVQSQAVSNEISGVHGYRLVGHLTLPCVWDAGHMPHGPLLPDQHCLRSVPPVGQSAHVWGLDILGPLCM